MRDCLFCGTLFTWKRGGCRTFREFFSGSRMIEDGLHDALYGAGLQAEGGVLEGNSYPCRTCAMSTRPSRGLPHTTGSSDDQLIAECNTPAGFQERLRNPAGPPVRPFRGMKEEFFKQ